MKSDETSEEEDDGTVIDREVARDIKAAEDEEYESNTLDEIIDRVVAKEENDSEDIQISDGESYSNEKQKTKTPKKRPTTTPAKKKAAADKSDKSDLEISFSNVKTSDDEKDGKTEYKAEKDLVIQRLRRLLRLAGLNKASMVSNETLNAMKSKKARYDFLKKCFTDAGFDKQITKENCKKFKEVMDRKKEIAELDLSMILHHF